MTQDDVLVTYVQTGIPDTRRRRKQVSGCLEYHRQGTPGLQLPQGVMKHSSEHGAEGCCEGRGVVACWIWKVTWIQTALAREGLVFRGVGRELPGTIWADLLCRQTDKWAGSFKGDVSRTT